MIRKHKRIWSLLLCIVIVITVLPTTAFAAGGDPMSTPLQEGWAKLGGFISGDTTHSVYSPVSIAVNSEIPEDNPNIYVTSNAFFYRVMKGTYNTGTKTYTFNDIGGTGNPNFTSANAPISLALDGGFISDGNLYVATNNMYVSPIKEKIWKFDGTNWTDITYGLGINYPSIAVDSGKNLYAVGTTGVRKVYVLWKDVPTTWKDVDLSTYITADLAAVAVPRNGFGDVFVLDKTGKIWRVRFGQIGNTTTLDTCIQIATAPGGGSSLAVVSKNSSNDGFDFYVTDASKKCIQALLYETNGKLPYAAQSWVVMQNDSPNTFNTPLSVALNWQGNLYVTDPGMNNGAVLKQHSVPALSWTVQPGSGISGNALSTQPQMALKYFDGYGNKVATGNSVDQVTVALTLAGSGALIGTQTVTLQSGLATFSDLGVTGPGTYTLTATCGGLTSVSSSFTVSPAPAITGVAAGISTFPASGGATAITVSGTNIINGIRVTAFDGATATDITSTTTGSGTNQTVSLTFPENTSTTADKVYTIKVSLDNGSTWDTQTATVTVSKAMASTAVLTGTAVISNINPRIGDVLNGSLDGGNNTGTLTYVWKVGGSQVDIDASYTVAETDLSKTITLEIASSVETGTVISTATAAVAKKAAPAAPSVPALSSKTHNSVTLEVNGLYVFSMDGTTWQTSNVFGSLTANTAYTFYQKVAETSDTEASAASTGLSVTTDTEPTNALVGTAVISNTEPRIGDVLNGSLDGGNNSGTLTFMWKSNGRQVGTGTSYTVATADLGKTIMLEITSSVETGAVTSTATMAVAKKAAPAAPSAPTLSSKTHNSVTLEANGLYVFSMDGSTWQTSNVFVSLTANTAYTFYQKVVETSDTEASVASTGFSVTTDHEPANALAGTAVISNINPRIGDVLNGSLDGGNNTGTLTYVWKADGIQVGTSTSYTVAVADLDKTITLEITSSVETGAVTSTATAAVTQPPPSYTYTVTFMNGSSLHTTKTVVSPTTTIDALPANPANGSYTFSGWYTGTGGSGTSFNASTPVTSNMTVYAYWTGGDSGGGGGGYTPAPPATDITIDKQPNMPTVAKMSVSGTVKDGVLSANITEQMVRNAIKAAQDTAEKSGNIVDGIAVDFGITGSGSYTDLNATIDAGAIDRLKEAGVRFIKIGSAVLDITLDAGAIAEIDRQSTGNVTVSARAQTKLSEAAKELIGSRPVFDITVGYQKNGETEYITNFGQGAVTLGIAYNATAKESTANLFGVYVDRNGRPQLLNSSGYNNGRLIFNRNSLSTYGVGYKASAPAFTDTAKHWAKDNIDFVTSRDLISGTSETTFAPNTAIVRADFLMALGRLSGADVHSYKTSSFTDVKNSDPAMPYIEWAVKNKIVSGYGNRKFGPNDPITREQIAVMMVNYAKATGYKMPISIVAVTFSDSAKIAAYAKDAVTAVQQTGVIVGKIGNLFDPQGNATRAEASIILRRFVEFVIDEGTARGWSRNDAEQWLYIGENGQAVTGWLTEENTKYYFTSDGIMVSGKWLEHNGKWYYFYANGSLAKSTKVDGYEVDENGIRKMK